MFKLLFKRKNIKKISQREAKGLISSDKKIVLLDVRTPEEYHEVHIPHSISLPLDTLKAKASKIVPDKDTEIITYCLSGIRAAKACRELSSMGYINVRNMGGLNKWKYETERG